MQTFGREQDKERNNMTSGVPLRISGYSTQNEQCQIINRHSSKYIFNEFMIKSVQTCDNINVVTLIPELLSRFPC